MTDALRQAFAIRYGIPAGDVPPLDGPDALAALLDRRSCRCFTGGEVPEPLFLTLLACAQSAPSKSDLQQYAILVLDDPVIRRTFQGLSSIPAWVADAGRILVFCGDTRRVRRMAEIHALPYDSDTADVFMNAATDAAIAMTAFLLAAEAVGLGCCPLSVVRNHAPELSVLLALPEGVFPWAGLAVGWPAGRAAVSPRLPQAVTVHRDRYDDRALGPALAAYDATRGPIAAGKQLHAERYGTDPALGWSANAARRLSVRERPFWRSFLEQRGIHLD